MSVASNPSKEFFLLSGLRNGDNRALREIYSSYFHPIAAYLKKSGASEDDAKDVFQETIMVAYRLVQTEEFELRSKLLSFLIGISRNIWLKMIRKRPLNVDISDPMFSSQLSDPSEDVLEEIRKRTIDQLYRKKLRELGEQCQRILDLFFEGKKMTKIVEELGLSSVSFAKKKKFQCKEALVDLVKADPLFVELKV